MPIKEGDTPERGGCWLLLSLISWGLCIITSPMHDHNKLFHWKTRKYLSISKKLNVPYPVDNIRCHCTNMSYVEHRNTQETCKLKQ